MEQNPYIFQLSNVIEYTKDGDFCQTAELYLRGPSMDEYNLSGRLAQFVTRAIVEAQELNQVIQSLDAETIRAAREAAAEKKKKDGKDQEEKESGMAMMAIMSSKSIKISEVADICKKLFVRVGTYDGKLPLREAVFKSISVNDFTRMMSGYIENFITPSLF